MKNGLCHKMEDKLKSCEGHDRAHQWWRPESVVLVLSGNFCFVNVFDKDFILTLFQFVLSFL